MNTAANDPGAFHIPFHVFYHGEEVAGFARGPAFPANRTFAVNLLGNSFEITAEQDHIAWRWHSNAADNPAAVLAGEIGLAIESFFAGRQA